MISAAERDELIRATDDMYAFLEGLVEAKRGHDDGDLLSTLVHAEEDGETLTHEELLAQFPPTLRELTRVPGLGFKTIALLWKECGIKSLAELQAMVAPTVVTVLAASTVEKLDRALISGRRLQRRSGGPRPLDRWCWYRSADPR